VTVTLKSYVLVDLSRNW